MSILGNLLSQFGSFPLADIMVTVRSKLNIVLFIDSLNKRIVFPIVPAHLPETESPQDNDTFNAVTGKLNVIGAMGLRQLTIESFFPVYKNYPFARSQATFANGWDFVNWIEKYRKQGVIFRIMIVETLGTVRLNMPCTIDSFKHFQNVSNDVSYSLALREYKYVDTTAISTQASEGEINE